MHTSPSPEAVAPCGCWPCSTGARRLGNHHRPLLSTVDALEAGGKLNPRKPRLRCILPGDLWLHANVYLCNTYTICVESLPRALSTCLLMTTGGQGSLRGIWSRRKATSPALPLSRREAPALNSQHTALRAREIAEGDMVAFLEWVRGGARGQVRKKKKCRRPDTGGLRVGCT